MFHGQFHLAVNCESESKSILLLTLPRRDFLKSFILAGTKVKTVYKRKLISAACGTDREMMDIASWRLRK